MFNSDLGIEQWNKWHVVYYKKWHRGNFAAIMIWCFGNKG